MSKVTLRAERKPVTASTNGHGTKHWRSTPYPWSYDTMIRKLVLGLAAAVVVAGAALRPDLRVRGRLPPPPSSSSPSSPPHLLRAGADHRRTGDPAELLAEASRADVQGSALAYSERLRVLIEIRSASKSRSPSGRGFRFLNHLPNRELAAGRPAARNTGAVTEGTHFIQNLRNSQQHRTLPATNCRPAA